MISNATLRRQHHQAAEEKHRAGRAWQQAGYQLLEIMQLHRAHLNAERSQDHRAADEIRERAQDFAAGGVSVRSGWSSLGAGLEAEHFRIDLAGGGPAVRIIGNLALGGEIDEPRLEYQDWGTPWIEFRLMNKLEYDAVDWYCNQFYWPGA